MSPRAALLALLCAAASLPSSTASVLCAWTKVSPSGELHHTFLRSELGKEVSLSKLYHGVWSAERALIGCTWSDDRAVVRSYLTRCQENPRDFNAPQELWRSLLEGEECVKLDTPRLGRRGLRSAGEEDGGSEVGRQRVKRGFIVPGTLWCGSGNKAPSYGDLGVFSETDGCCREHDQCQHTILSFHSEFGVFNSNIFTMSHCNCDNKFHKCLREANDSISSVVGYTFFNLLKMHCFTFSHRLQCAKRNWFGMCKESQMALYAEVHPPTLFESVQSEACANGSCPNITATLPDELLKISTSHPQASPITPAAPPTPRKTHPESPHVTSVTNGSSSTSSNKVATATRLLQEGRDDQENALPAKHPAVIEQHVNLTEEETPCALYKALDDCKSKIPPQRTKYGLSNTNIGTLYHCNCTARLFQSLAEQRKLTNVETLLLGYVARSCFLFQNCTPGNTCPAVLVEASGYLNQLGPADVGEQRPLLAVALKVRRPKTRAVRKDRPVRLYKLCVRRTQPGREQRSRRGGQQSAEQE